jgi:hypothetical protein
MSAFEPQVSVCRPEYLLIQVENQGANSCSACHNGTTSTPKSCDSFELHKMQDILVKLPEPTLSCCEFSCFCFSTCAIHYPLPPAHQFIAFVVSSTDRLRQDNVVHVQGPPRDGVAVLFFVSTNVQLSTDATSHQPRGRRLRRNGSVFLFVPQTPSVTSSWSCGGLNYQLIYQLIYPALIYCAPP